MTPHYDAIIVGARCAGASTALQLARRGYRVLLVDRATFPSDTISGHYIMHPGVRKLAEWGLLDRVIVGGCPPIRRISSDVGDGMLTGDVELESGLPVCVAPRRIYLDALLLEAAIEAGAEWREQVVIDGLIEQDGRVVGVRGRGAQGQAFQAQGRMVIGADSKHSTVAKLVGATERIIQPTLTCWYMGYWEGLDCSGLEIHWRHKRLVFAFPTNDQQAMIAVCWPRSEFEAFRSDIAGNYLATAQMMPLLAERLPEARQVGRLTGMADLPNFVRQAYGPGWALVGDASYHKDPVLARGISDAFVDAEALAIAIDKGLSGAQPFDAALAEYQEQRDALALPDLENNLDSAYLVGWDAPEIVRLRAALRQHPAEAGLFFASQMRAISPQEFFTPERMAMLLPQS
jgi:flavin-dependent dehydrogenase